MLLRWWCKVRQQRSQQLFSQCTPDSYRKRCRHEMHQYHSPLRVNQDRCLTRTSRTHRAVIRAAAYNVCKLCGASLEPARPSARGNVRLRGAGGAYTGRLAFVRSPVRMTPGVGLLTDHFSPSKQPRIHVTWNFRAQKAARHFFSAQLVSVCLK